MFNILTLNKIANCGLNLLDKNKYTITDDNANPDAIILRSFNMHETEINDNLVAVARAGAGVNNIPIDKCSEKGVIVFNTPGANANAVKELVIAAILLSSRKIVEGINWTKTLKDSEEDVSKVVEKGKKNFVGPEISGKTLGVVGLGAIGAKVANTAIHLGMEVMGYDPFISIDGAWRLSTKVKKATTLKEIFENCDYITLHLPFTPDTKDTIDAEALDIMKDDVRIINLARGGLVNTDAILKAIESGKVAKYVTDFADKDLLGKENILCIPHLGASTPESEDNCAIMAAKEVRDYLENGNITNSVNFPNCKLERSGETRVCLAHKNIPNMIGQITAFFAGKNINIENLINKSRGDYAYTIVDIDGHPGNEIIDSIEKIEGMLKVRVL